LLLRCGLAADRVLQIATSATIGSSETDELAAFAAKLFTKNKGLVNVIQGRQMRVELSAAAPPPHAPLLEEVIMCEWLTCPTLHFDSEGQKLSENSNECHKLTRSLKLL